VGASIYVQARDAEEMAALESEGSPHFHVTYTTLGIVLVAVGYGHLDVYGDSIDPENLPALIEDCRYVQDDDALGKGWAIRQLGDVAKAALAVNRGVGWS
jgi:hypothetical protein